MSTSMQCGKTSSLTEVRRVQIFTWHGEGCRERDIAAKLRCSMTAVRNAIVKCNADGTLPQRNTTPREDHSMRQIVMRSPKSSCKKIHPVLRTPISSSTVSRRLSKESGLKSHRPAWNPYLTPVVKKKRLDFVRRHRHWTLAECCFLTNAPYSSLYLATCTLGGHWVRVPTRNMLYPQWNTRRAKWFGVPWRYWSVFHSA